MTERGIRVRFAPSPSGDLHVGNIRTALYDWAFARAKRGTFVLRIEDTDATRVKPEYIASAQDTLRWLGLDWDEGPGVGGPFGPYLQSERMDIYAEWVERFLADGHAYHCYCTPEELEARRQAARQAGGPSGYDGHCRVLTAGQVPDFVLARADGSPLYTLAVAVDDVLMKITHVVRGEDLLSSTPRQIAVYRAMGVPADQIPVFAHLPYVLGPNGQKLSKRNGVVSINWYREQGFLPEAICNYLALLGWSPGENRESFTLAEMAEEFDLARVNKNSAQFDVRKLEAINGDKIRALEPAGFAARITPFLARAGLVTDPPSASQAELIAAGAPLIQERISKLSDAAGMLGFLFTDGAGFKIDPDDAARVLTPASAPVLAAADKALAELDEWTYPEIRRALETALLEGLDLKPRTAYAPVRVAVTGRRVSPPLFESMELLGRDKTLYRVARALAVATAAA